ncbi:hypothetical protein CRV15_25235 [Streptomyces clavuligerus]|uniref:Uncharacterized protein n=1 Tax=Streptomyces clavuligerus TaxID=1901 RepID=B5GZ04_STRCL|nr:hypothetical protein D1794_25865 [Streptomyces clavuligerus]EDY51551.1 hypothetical protein SSCG_04430 [Streptomyces clavuligerus]EFG05677.1 Hypothetical protein SCLAV_0601 [Streptomyces clavuligerus]QCS09487.1 hypothetical protein CRV15_25235 [Streptomyces clavuligerus]QPJ92047.1 hypothetical protein GE265_02905 [Streptomyces clavuligerus]
MSLWISAGLTGGFGIGSCTSPTSSGTSTLYIPVEVYVHLPRKVGTTAGQSSLRRRTSAPLFF